MTLTKTSKDWQDLLMKDLELQILDPDGWDRSNYDYSFNEEKISANEFRKRICRSTCMMPVNSFEELDKRIEAFTDEAEDVISKGRG